MHYSLRISRNKSVDKLKDQDWEAIEKEALEGIFKLIKRHLNVHLMSEEGDSTTVLEYEIEVETPKTYKYKENMKQLEFETRKGN